MKTKILLVEDIKLKRDEINEFVTNFYSIVKKDFDLHIATNYQEATHQIDNYNFDKVILDMTLPESHLTLINSTLNPFAGEDLLFEFNCLETPPKIIVLTMYDNFKVESEYVTLSSLEKRIIMNFQKLNLNFAYYQTGSSQWKNKLKDFLEN